MPRFSPPRLPIAPFSTGSSTPDSSMPIPRTDPACGGGQPPQPGPGPSQPKCGNGCDGCRKIDAVLIPEEDNLRVRSSIPLPADLREAIKVNKAKLLLHLRLCQKSGCCNPLTPRETHKNRMGPRYFLLLPEVWLSSILPVGLAGNHEDRRNAVMTSTAGVTVSVAGRGRRSMPFWYFLYWLSAKEYLEVAVGRPATGS